ncbi:probable pectinesterase/pectinesterase inhibitor 36 [Diospyros lotus]|uniref:probable pectinesterase/pectinesterase inhibitor 36 n=1 Tax=Diospyros lotus TaxID=55363 RepID=UPI002254A721|nr:probable pectinesterase/pectinesterase inhibitor 36 [Diospyros lotus]
MSTWLPAFLFFLATANTISCTSRDRELVQAALAEIRTATDWARASLGLLDLDQEREINDYHHVGVPLADCFKLYEEADPRLRRLVSSHGYTWDDAVTWLSGALASHRSCLDGLEEKGLLAQAPLVARNLTVLLREGLALHRTGKKGYRSRSNENYEGVLASWNAASSKADLVVAQDGSGNHRTITAAVAALAHQGRSGRAIIYVKSGVYKEKVEIKGSIKNLMLVGDGIDKTIVTGNKNVVDGATTLSSATFGVSGDGFWARDITFENTAGPQKNQAVALRVSSDLAVFYRCSIKGYQDTLYIHSQRQFYRDCHIYGTVDFIFGDSPAVFQNCDIFVRRPMDHQSNMITAQGRDDPNENTGISIVNSRVVAAPEFGDVKGRFRSYLGRPWKRYSRTVFLKTNLDGLIDPKGWTEWRGDFALSSLYYGEYMNSGAGASTAGRVRWPGFHVISDAREASSFAAKNFIQGDQWIPASGVPFWAEV